MHLDITMEDIGRWAEKIAIAIYRITPPRDDLAAEVFVWSAWADQQLGDIHNGSICLGG